MRSVFLTISLAFVGVVDTGCHYCTAIDDSDFECGPAARARLYRSTIDHRRVSELENQATQEHRTSDIRGRHDADTSAGAADSKTLFDETIF